MTERADPVSRPNELLSAIYQRASDAFLVADDSGHFVEANPAALRLTGYALEEIRGLAVWDLLSPEVRAAFPAVWASFLEGDGNSGEYVLVRKDGTLRAVEFRAVPHVLPGLHLSILVDVTDRKRAERRADEELRRSEERLSMALAIAQIGTFEIDLLTDDVIVNERGREMYGWTPDLVLNLSLVQTHFHPDDRAWVVQAVEAALQPSGPGAFEIEQRIVRTDGEERWIRVRGQGLYEGHGPGRRPVRCVGTYVDTTEQRRWEESLRAHNEELERRVAERTSELQAAADELESFAHSASHDLRAPLRTVDLSRAMLLDDPDSSLSAEAVELLARQETAVARMNRLITDLLNFARLSHQDLSPIELDVSDIALRAWHEITRERPDDKARLTVQDGMRARGDPVLVRFVYQNLLQNALKFSPAGGPVRVGQEANGAFYVRDAGIGFDMAHAGKLFQPFQRLVGQSEFPGSGIGLANVKRIVGRHHGQVWAESERGKGATFFFTLE